MEKNLYIDASHPTETRVVLKSSDHIEEYEYENKNKLHIKNNIYLGKISRVEPSLQAAFVDFGRQRHGFLAFNDIQTEYYQLPHDDKQKLKENEEAIREKLKEESKKIEESTIAQDSPDENQHDKKKDLSSEQQDDSTNQNEKINNIKQRFGVKRYEIYC